jgi:hypothetical protein
MEESVEGQVAPRRMLQAHLRGYISLGQEYVYGRRHEGQLAKQLESHSRYVRRTIISRMSSSRFALDLFKLG